MRVGTTLEMNSAQGRLFLRYSRDRHAVTKYWESLQPGERARIEAEVAEAGVRGLTQAEAPMGMSILAAPVFDDHDIAATVAVVGTPLGDPVAAALRRAAYGITNDLAGTDLWRSLLPAPTA